MAHLTMDQLVAGQDAVVDSPADNGTLELLVARPGVDQRDVLDSGELVVGEGLAGDNYVERGNPRAADGNADPEAQLNVMNSRAIDLVADGDRERWPLAGDQLFVDLDLSVANLPTGTRLAIGTAVIEVSAKPHTGCAKFAKRFGLDAAKWANSDPERRYRGINAIVVEGGSLKPGDTITKLG
ncbi:MAG: MOSC domain-containing protein [Acidimicrobiia bacterium]|nr:MOSC domain-containing protein [Acidimicrobiia bacterium]